MTWDPEQKGDGAGLIKYDIVPYTRGVVLDLGCGPYKPYAHFIGIDNKKDTDLFGIEMRPDLVADVTNLQAHIEDASCDAVFSSHLLEHIEDTAATLKSWWQTIKVGGHLVLYLPHCDLYPRIGTPGANIDHVHDFHPDDIVALMRGVGGWDLVENETRDQGQECSFYQVYRKRGDWKQVMAYRHKPQGPTCCVVRYGGVGDMLQMANILPELKRQGYHVTVNTHPIGKELLEHDPHVDAWFIQDRNQVPNPELWEYWSVWKKKFDKWVNLSGSVEDALLARPGSPQHFWPHAMRHRLLNRNYGESTAEIAEVPYKSEARFYATPDEEAKATAFLRNMGAEFTIMWTLSGSSPHKFYPHQDVVIRRVLDDMPGAKVILAGDTACKILEAGWEDEPRVVCTSGEMSIRDTLALAQLCDVVVGPETGVLNAVAFEPSVGKIVLLSHSSAENLTKHWANTTSLASQNMPCYPCHQLHTTMRYCREHEESGAAMCQADIPPDEVSGAIRWHYALATSKRIVA